MQTYKYALFNRPAGIGCIPKNLLYSVTPRPLEGEPHYPMARHGVLVCERKLTTEELRNFQLSPLVDESDANLFNFIAENVAYGRMSDYADAYIEQSRDDPKLFTNAVYQGLERINSGVYYSIGNMAAFEQLVIQKLTKLPQAKAKVWP